MEGQECEKALHSPHPVRECRRSARNILAIYTGRWRFLRIQLAHVYRELRSNGGVLDVVWFMIIKCDSFTMEKLKNFTKVANAIQGKDVFKIYNKHMNYSSAYNEFFNHLSRYPYDRFFKFDDDIVYIHPRIFEQILEKKDTSSCFIHFLNIAGSNWRCSVLHQKIGVYNETNPKKLIFDDTPNGICGWKSPDCSVLSLRTFLHHYTHNTLSKYKFKENLEILSDKRRFSINAFLMDKDIIDIPRMLEVGKIWTDDEKWWTELLTAKVDHPNCIVSDALVVHFAYHEVVEALLKLGLLEEFAMIVEKNLTTFKMEPDIIHVLEFSIK